MSYCRHGFFRDEGGEVNASDVYLILSEFWECCGCKLQRSMSVLGIETGHQNSIRFDSQRKVLAHLWKHRLEGHIVPQHTFDRLEEEIAEIEIEESEKRVKEMMKTMKGDKSL